MKSYLLNSFTKNHSWGNPAWVVLDADNLSDTQMQEIAAKIWVSETAFVKKSHNADFHLQFFTPNSEVDLCWHATIASFYLMKTLWLIQEWEYTQQTKAGNLKIEISEEWNIFMQQNKVKFYEILNDVAIQESLGIKDTQVHDSLPIQIVSTWLKDILAPVKSLQILQNLKIDLEKISDISNKYNSIWLHVFSLESESGWIAQSRNFAPLYGIPEESATGTSTWALTGYFQTKSIIKKWKQNLSFEQWYTMWHPSELIVKIEDDNSVILWWSWGNIQELDIKY
jgi:PhzF family phenazine biosynthesis protein